MGGTLATMSDERSDDGPSDPPLTKRASKLPADEDGVTEENPEHSALVALGAVIEAGRELLDQGTYGFWEGALEGSRHVRQAFKD